MTKTELDELEQKYLQWQDTKAGKQVLQLIADYRQLADKKTSRHPTCKSERHEAIIKARAQNLELFEDEA